MQLHALRSDSPLTPRQGEVLESALALLVESGDAFTMNALAQRANCSKETLYKWFGDREGLLTATVQYQAAKVRVAPLDPARLDTASLRDALTAFATDLLTVIAGETSVALNRLAVANASAGQGLGRLVLQNGRHAIGRRLKPVLETARALKLLAFADAESAYRSFFGLVVRDTQIRLLLGDRFDTGAATLKREAAEAVDQFLSLYATKTNGRRGARPHERE